MELYSPVAPILWNGKAFPGPQPYSEFYNQLPISLHKINSLDSHPVQTGEVLINVSGTVKYAETEEKLFSETFLLSQNQASTWFGKSVNWKLGALNEFFQVLHNFSSM
ncbi:NTF2- export protein 2 [Lobulomyces angularis]|nr:NTF2- export protein 2 [Lobulomyces angularis]